MYALVLPVPVHDVTLVGDVFEDAVDVGSPPRLARLLVAETLVELDGDLPRALDDEIPLEDEPYALRRLLVHDKLGVLRLGVAVGRGGGSPASRHPCGADLPVDALGVDLPLVLREVHEDARRGASAARLHLDELRGGDDSHVVLPELVYEAPEVALVAADAVELVDHDHVDLAGANGVHHLLELRAVRGPAGEPAVGVDAPREPPAFTRVAFDVRLAGVRLAVDGRVVAVEPVRRALAAVDDASLLRSWGLPVLDVHVNPPASCS